MTINTSYKMLALAFTALLGATNLSADEINIKLAEPTWTFSVANNAVNPKSLKPAENSFVRDLQEQLKTKNYQAVNKQLQGFTSSEQSGAMLLLRGQIALALKDFTQAQKWLEQAAKKEPSLTSAHNGLALIYLTNNNFEQARPHLQASLEHGEQNSQIIGQLAYVNMQLGYSAAAVAGFRQAMFLDATNKEWQQGLLFSLIRSGALTQASAMLDKMLDKEPLNKELWMLRSQVALQSKDNLEALSSLESALTLGEKDPDNMMTAVQLHLTSGSTKRAVELLSAPELLNKSIKPHHQQELLQIASWLAAKGQWNDLQTLLTRSKKQAVSKQLSAVLAVSEAKLAIHQGKLSTAEKALKKALKQAPTLGDALLEFAKLLKQQKRYTQAKQYYVRAEALPEYREQALLGRAKIAIDQNKYSEALHLVGTVAKENPKRTDLVATIESLKNLVRNTI